MLRTSQTRCSDDRRLSVDSGGGTRTRASRPRTPGSRAVHSLFGFGGVPPSGSTPSSLPASTWSIRRTRGQLGALVASLTRPETEALSRTGSEQGRDGVDYVLLALDLQSGLESPSYPACAQGRHARATGPHGARRGEGPKAGAPSRYERDLALLGSWSTTRRGKVDHIFPGPRESASVATPSAARREETSVRPAATCRIVSGPKRSAPTRFGIYVDGLGYVALLGVCGGGCARVGSEPHNPGRWSTPGLVGVSCQIAPCSLMRDPVVSSCVGGRPLTPKNQPLCSPRSERPDSHASKRVSRSVGTGDRRVMTGSSVKTTIKTPRGVSFNAFAGFLEARGRALPTEADCLDSIAERSGCSLRACASRPVPGGPSSRAAADPADGTPWLEASLRWGSATNAICLKRCPAAVSVCSGTSIWRLPGGGATPKRAICDKAAHGGPVPRLPRGGRRETSSRPQAQDLARFWARASASGLRPENDRVAAFALADFLRYLAREGGQITETGRAAPAPQRYPDAVQSPRTPGRLRKSAWCWARSTGNPRFGKPRLTDGPY